ncbi:MAG: DUF4304 domain-containing protein [Spirochaetes bacterium]|nr:DUF4304 domain-containing protein [Spirochaetota bacterium]
MNTVSEYRKWVKDIIKEELKPFLLKNGFKTTGAASFYKIEPDLVKFIDLEFSRWNTYIAFAFWFNLHIYAGTFSEEKSISIKLLVTKGSPLFFKNISFLREKEFEQYQITPATNMESLLNDIKTDFSSHVIPFSERFKCVEDFIGFAESEHKRLGQNDYSYRLAVMMAKSGRMSEAKKYFQESIGDREDLVKAAQIYGIDLNS